MTGTYRIAKNWEEFPIGAVVMDAAGAVGAIEKSSAGRLVLRARFRRGTPKPPFAMLLDPGEAAHIAGVLHHWKEPDE